VSPPLATAVVAGIAALLLLIDVLRGNAAPTGPREAAVVADPPVLVAAPPFRFADPMPEPAAGPDTLETGARGTGAPDTRGDEQRPAGRRTLPEVPDVPAELDDIARELQRRRAEVLELEAGLALREAAVRAAETDLKAQVDRLEAFKRELEALVGEAEAEEEERLQQLVRMYESMRAKSAAAIFDRLELPVILAVAKRMREARMAAILAAMDPARARVVTSELAQERGLPRLE
jgi:flagellar motility protein MotE (MotC chaperone)